MGRATVTVTIEASIEAAFDFVAEPANTPRFMSGITRYEPIGDRSRGKGARFDSRAVVAGKHFDVELEVTEWKDNQRMVATSRKGPRTEGTWSFEEFDDGSTDVTLLYEYELPIIFRFVPGVNGIIEGNLVKSLQKLKKLIEADTKRAPRRAAKATSKGKQAERPGRPAKGPAD
jgi:uncharacterized membrane protein